MSVVRFLESNSNSVLENRVGKGELGMRKELLQPSKEGIRTQGKT